MKKILLYFSLFFYLTTSLHASSGYGASVYLQSPLVQETEAGTIVTASFLVSNQQEGEETYSVDLELPPGWISIPFQEPFFTLKGQETKVELIAIRVPSHALAGRYPIKYKIQGRQHPSIISESSFFIEILKRSEIHSFIKQSPKYKIAGDPYEVTFTVTNTGNIGTEIEISVKDSMNFPVSIVSEDSTYLKPGESKEFVALVTTPKDLKDSIRHFLTISTQIKDSPNTLCYLSSETDLFPKKPTKEDPYHCLPMKTVFGYGMKNGKKQLFIEQYGSGPLDEIKKKNLDLFARIPFIQGANVDRDLGGLPENAYLHYWDSFADVYGGDGVYTLTPLTMLNRFGRGGSLSIHPGPVSLKGVYVHNTSSVPFSSIGGDLSYSPTTPLSLSFSILQTNFTEQSERILSTSETALSHSLMGLFKDDVFGEHTIELAKTGPIFSSEKNHRSYYLYSRAFPTQDLWYALQVIYAEPDFVGYYQDTNQLYGSIGFPIVKRLQGTLSYNGISYNLKKNQKKGSAPRNKTAYGGLSYSFPFGLYTSMYYNFSQAKNSINDIGYQTQYASLNGGQTFNHWTLQGIFEYGHFYEIQNARNQHMWQNYQIYTYYQPTPRQQYSIYTRIGYMQLLEEISWSRIYGISTAWSPKNVQFNLLYEYTDQTNFRHYFSSSLNYTLPNKHSFAMQGYWNKTACTEGVLEFLLSYTIPWGLPIRKNKKAGGIRGQISKKDLSEKETPYSNLIVHCNGMKTLTDTKGHFAFSSLKPGDYHLWAEENSHRLVASTPEPLLINVQGGQSAQAIIRFEHPAKLTGTIPLFDFPHFPEGEMVQKGFVENATLILESASTKEKIFISSDAQGSFAFDKLAPGRWLLKVLIPHMPTYHYLEQEEYLLDLFPGELKSLELKVLPIKRKLRMIDSDTIHS